MFDKDKDGIVSFGELMKIVTVLGIEIRGNSYKSKKGFML